VHRPQYRGADGKWDWLDAARFADTKGFSILISRPRTMRAGARGDLIPQSQHPFNDVYDRKLRWVDLLPKATGRWKQKIAKRFQSETHDQCRGWGGSRTKLSHAYLIDRVHTTATSRDGFDVACAQCHDHK